MIRSYSFQNSRAFPMACATFETTAQKTLGTLACSAIYDSFSWNASLRLCILKGSCDAKNIQTCVALRRWMTNDVEMEEAASATAAGCCDGCGCWLLRRLAATDSDSRSTFGSSVADDGRRRPPGERRPADREGSVRLSALPPPPPPPPPAARGGWRLRVARVSRQLIGWWKYFERR